MNKEELIEMNKVIARFMGYEYFGFDPDNKNKNYGFTDEYLGWRLKNLPNRSIKAAPKNWFLCRKHFELPFADDWAWLMEVVAKIHSIGEDDLFCTKDNYHITIGKRFTRIIYDYNKYLKSEFIVMDTDKIVKDYRFSLFNESPILATFQAVYDFIIWYNERSTKN